MSKPLEEIRKENEKLRQALVVLTTWFEDNMGQESWLDPDDKTGGPNGTWKPYADLPEYVQALKVLKES